MLMRLQPCQNLSDSDKVNRGCSAPLTEPHLFDYDPATHTLTKTGEVVPVTCRVCSHPQREVLYRALYVGSLLEKNHLTLNDVSAKWYSLALLAKTEWGAHSGRN